MSDKLLGQSVTANLEINGFEIDFTITQADAEAQRGIISEVMSIVEEVAGIEVGTGSTQTTQIHSGFRIDHGHAEQQDLTPA